MADFGDLALVRQEELLNEALRNKRGWEPGKKQCIHCGYRNDRADKGFDVCSECFEELNSEVE